MIWAFTSRRSIASAARVSSRLRSGWDRAPSAGAALSSGSGSNLSLLRSSQKRRREAQPATPSMLSVSTLPRLKNHEQLFTPRPLPVIEYSSPAGVPKAAEHEETWKHVSIPLARVIARLRRLRALDEEAGR